MSTSASDEAATQRMKLLRYFKENRLEAHHYLFEHRHKDEDAPFMRDYLDLLYSDDPMVAALAFRGAGKSTLAEEWIILSVLFQELKFPLLISYKEEMAAEHLAPIRNEFETNDRLIGLFGDQKSNPWASTELCLVNGTKIQAIGAGQSMRGKKHNDERPDAALIDDLEDEDSILTDTQRHKTDRWLMGTLIPALHPTQRKVRFIGTAIHPKSLIVRKTQDPKWKSAIFPLIKLDMDTGEEKSAWPSRFPMTYVNELRDNYYHSGNLIEFEQEYMCRAEDMAAKPFQASMFRIEPVDYKYLPVQIMVDPARTTKEKSARTGYAAWSWVGNKLIVHKAVGKFHKPDEIINEIVEWDKQFRPVHIGVEAVGLEDFILQPLRMKCQQIGRGIPFMDVRAPKDKIDFIKGLQPYYHSHEVIHVEHHPDLESELVQFPTGRIDVLNALAYAMRLKPGRPVYVDFTTSHIAPVLEPFPAGDFYLCASSRMAMTAGVLVQYGNDRLRIYKDFIYNEPPQECFGRMVREAVLFAGKPIKLAAPMDQFNEYSNTGLPAAVKMEGLHPLQGAKAGTCEGALKGLLTKQAHGSPAFLIHPDARWTINGLALGYARRLNKHGVLDDEPADDQYRVVLEALESFIAWLEKSGSITKDEGFKVAYTESGRGYYSLRG